MRQVLNVLYEYGSLFRPQLIPSRLLSRLFPMRIYLFILVCLVIPYFPGSNSILSADDSVERINQFIEAKWDSAGIQPAQDVSENVFVRRLYLDLVGRIPTRKERQTYLDDQRPNKRELLVDQLLKSEDYVQHFTDVFDTLLMGRGKPQQYRERQNHQWRNWLERVFRENRSWNEVVAEILLARPEKNSDRGVVWYLYERKDNHQEIAEAIAPAFFGIRIECAQCHDHMIAGEIEQAHYWGLVAFFNRSKNSKSPNGPRVAESAIGGFSEFANLEGSSSPNLLTFFGAETVNETRPKKDEKEEETDEKYVPSSLKGDPRVPKFSRREQFVENVVKEHPLIARAFVNRVWAMMLGRGIVHPFDEMDSVHEPSHPELLDWLSEGFRVSGYDIRRLVRNVVLSRPYQLASIPPEGVNDPAFFAWSIERPLTAEQLARSIQIALRGKFRNDSPLVEKLRAPFPDVLPDVASTNVKDALFLTNNAALNDFISQSQSENDLLDRARKLTPEEQSLLLFETIFSRQPTAEETSRVTEYMASGEKSPRLQQVIWAMLTSAEFRLNH